MAELVLEVIFKKGLNPFMVAFIQLKLFYILLHFNFDIVEKPSKLPCMEIGVSPNTPKDCNYCCKGLPETGVVEKE